MKRAIAGLSLFALLSAPVFAQSTSAPSASAPQRFEIADIHTSPHRTFPFLDGGALFGDRYAIHQATMVDLITTAYGLDPENVQGGPIWLETDRFDIIAKVAPGTPKATLKLMLQSLLAERFHLVTHTGSKPMPAYVLTVAKDKPKFTEGSGDVGCKYQPPPPNQPPGTISNIAFACQNVTMETFAQDLHQWGGDGYITKPVVDSTGLQGGWNFDIKWTQKGQLAQAGSDGISLFDAVDKQLGLKLELQTAPRSVLLVDSVDQKPTANSPEVAKVLPPLPPPQFDVAVIKPGQPGAQFRGKIDGGQVNVTGATLKFLIVFAWDLNPNDNEAMANAPKWLDSDRFDILAKASHDTLRSVFQDRPQIGVEDLRLMLRALFVDRFQIQTHMEDRPVSAYTLIAVNPKLRKADPLSRTRCTEGPGPDGKDPRLTSPVLNRLLTCQNMTMAQIGDELQRVAAGYIYNPVLDGTGIKGSWDFTLSFSSADKIQASAAAPSADGSSAASDPNGALSVFDAVSRQLGLKLEKQKRPAPVLVIDHIEEKPTDN